MSRAKLDMRMFLFSWLTLFLAMVLWAKPISAQLGGPPSEAQKPSLELEKLFSEVVNLLRPESMSPGDDPVAGPRCATALIATVQRRFHEFTASQREQLATILGRPGNLELSVATQAGYRIHYTLAGNDAVSKVDEDGNSVPDFIDSVAAAFDFSHEVEVVQLGYQPPPDDFGIDGTEYDVYVRELNGGSTHGIYGFTTSELEIATTHDDDRTSFIVLDNDFDDGHFTTGVPAAQVTAAHELFHAIQLGLRYMLSDNETFYYELCSSWMEDVVYDGVNDYYGTVSDFMSKTGFPLNLYQQGVTYGAAIWNHFLVEQTGDAAVIRSIWETMRAGMSATDAIREVLNRSNSFEHLFAEFGLWNYFTDSRATQMAFYEEARAYAPVRMRLVVPLSSDTTIVDSLRTLSSRYYRFVLQETSSFLLTVRAQNAKNWGNKVIIEQTNQVPEFLDAPVGESLKLDLLSEGSAVVVVVSNVAALADKDPGRLRDTFSAMEMSLVRLSQRQGDSEITAIYPNPFFSGRQESVVFEFSPLATVDVEARILNGSGDVIREARLVSGDRGLTTSRFVWDGRTDQGRPSPSGIFIFQLKQGGNVSYRKFAVIRE